VAPLINASSQANAVSFVRGLAAYGDQVALVTAQTEISYRALAARVDAVAGRLGDARRLILLTGANEVDAIVCYLAALSAGHPLLLVPGDNPAHVESLVATYDPDVVVRRIRDEWTFQERRAVSAHDLHPDLALLLSTSGSTGSPKLVRLSHQNVQANAESIADYLRIRSGDRAATTLPMHYCYGLSVINSHLLRGAGLILTDLSVVDTCFWDLFRTKRGTTFAGVPYTFELLDRVDFAAMQLRDLRYVTQAGGRLAPDLVRRYAQLGERHGWDLFVMYGQTEATARMAYLPPRLAASRPEAIGIPIPGGSFSLEPVPDSDNPDTGELVYAGPNVMLGYAESPSDLRLGRTVDTLRTGDIARRASDDLYEVVARRSAFLKIFGLRIDPQRVEAFLAGQGMTAYCVGNDGELVVAVEGADDPDSVRRLTAQQCGLPERAVRICVLDCLPRLPTGKPDYRAVRDLARTTEPAPAPPPTTDLRALYAEILGRSDVTDDSTFVSLGGDSLSYVEISLRLEQALGHLPAGWHTMPIRDLVPADPPRFKRGHALDTSIALRAIAIVLVVGTHAQLFTIRGGAHLLLGIAGFNFARFHLTSAERGERARRLLSTITRIAAASMTWIALACLLAPNDYGLANIFLLNGLLGPDEVGSEWRYWFIEALVAILLVLTVLLSIPLVDKIERRAPFALPLALMTLGLATRFKLVVIDIGGVDRFTPHVVFWLFALGWAAAKAASGWQRWCVTLAVVATVPGFFGAPLRETIVIGGLLLLVWVPSVRAPGLVSRSAAVLAGSSLYIYLTHWHIYIQIRDYSPLVAVLASLLFGVLYAKTVPGATAVLSSVSRRLAAHVPGKWWPSASPAWAAQPRR
jgi:acyl-CoA synthetase (AMP-forming)/AMP-acid ligase II